MKESKIDTRWFFVCTGDGYGGHEIMTRRLVSSLRQIAGNSVQYVIDSGSRMERETASEDRVVWPGRGLAGRLRLALWLRAKERDGGRVLLVCGSIKDKVGLATLLGILRVPFIVYVPLTDPFSVMGYKHGLLQDLAFRRMYSGVPAAWLTLVETQAEQLRSWLGVNAPIFTLPNTIARELEENAAKFRLSREHSSRLQVLVLGRLDAHQKGLDALLDFLRKNLFDVSEWAHFNVVGDGPYRAALEEALASEPLLAKVLTLHSWMQTADALRRCDVLFLPSRYEGVPLVMLEAMCFGRPVVAAKLAGTSQFLSEECLFEFNDLLGGVHILKQLLRPEVYRRAASDVVYRYESRASGSKFEVAVKKLVDDLKVWDGK